jgi:hypothetical protein
MYKKQLMFFLFMLILASAFFLGCNKNETNAGIGILPDNLKLNTNIVDTFSVVAYTQEVDALPTNGVSKVLLGSYIDPIFGGLKASFVTQIIPSSVSKFGSLSLDSTTIDSMTMSVRLDTTDLKAYGTLNSNCEINIMWINKEFRYDDTIYHNYNIDDLNPNLLQSFILNPQTLINEAIEESDTEYERLVQEAIDDILEDDPDAVVDIDSIRDEIDRPDTIPRLKIKFNDDFRDQVFDWLVETQGESQTFYQLFNGFLFTPANDLTNAAISSFYHNTAGSEVTLHYNELKKVEDTSEIDGYRIDTIYTDYNFALSSAVRFNIFEHTFPQNIESSLNQPNSQLYVQGGGGLRVKITLPYLSQLREQGKIGVNRAELILPVAGDEVNNLPKPETLILLAINDDGELIPLTEYTGSSSYLGVTYDDNQYKFDITYWLQEYLLGKVSNNEFMLLISDEKVNPSRVVLTNDSLTNKMKLSLTLTPL